MRLSKAEREQNKSEARATLSKLCTPGTKVYTTVHKVAPSGMSRTMRVFVVDPDTCTIRNITWHVAHLLGWSLKESDGERVMVVEGAGMCMGFHTVYTLGRVLYPNGGPTDRPRNGSTSNHEPDGGYLLEREWL